MVNGEQPDASATAATASLGRRWRRSASRAVRPAVACGLGIPPALLIFGYHATMWAGLAFFVAIFTIERIIDERRSGSDPQEPWIDIVTGLAVTVPPFAAIYLLPARVQQGLTAAIIVAALEVLAIMIFAAIPVRPRTPPTAAGTGPGTPNH